MKCTFLPAKLERGTKALHFDVRCKAIDQNFDCGCDSYGILRLDTLLMLLNMLENITTDICSGHTFPGETHITVLNIGIYKVEV